MGEWGFFGDDEEESRPRPSKAFRKIIYDKDRGKCYICGKKVDPFDFELARNIPGSRGGKYTFKNSHIAHPVCNRSQGTKTFKQFKREMGLKSEDSRTKDILKTLSIPKLKLLAQKHHIKVKGSIVEDWGGSYRNSPTKIQYVNALAKVLSEKRIESELKKIPVVKKRRKRRSSNDDWW